MSRTLLLRIAGPMQSWGVGSKYEGRRNTERIPTKSGIVGLLASAMGRRRDQDIEDLAQLRFGVRVDREGILLRDFHTARPINQSPYISTRYYLCDACFLVGVEGDFELIEQLDWSLKHPVFPLFLGRRSCPPEGRINLGIQDQTLLEALSNHPSLIVNQKDQTETNKQGLRIYLEELIPSHPQFIRDHPVSFNSKMRQYEYRPIIEKVVHMKNNPDDKTTYAAIGHDPMAPLEE